MSTDESQVWIAKFERLLRHISPIKREPWSDERFEEIETIPVLSLVWDQMMTSSCASVAIQCTDEGRILWDVDGDTNECRALAVLGPFGYKQHEAVGALVLWWFRHQAPQGVTRPDRAVVEGVLDVATVNALINSVWPREEKP